MTMAIQVISKASGKPRITSVLKTAEMSGKLKLMSNTYMNISMATLCDEIDLNCAPKVFRLICRLQQATFIHSKDIKTLEKSLGIMGRDASAQLRGSATSALENMGRLQNQFNELKTLFMKALASR